MDALVEHITVLAQTPEAFQAWLKTQPGWKLRNPQDCRACFLHEWLASVIAAHPEGGAVEEFTVGTADVALQARGYCERVIRWPEWAHDFQLRAMAEARWQCVVMLRTCTARRLLKAVVEGME